MKIEEKIGMTSFTKMVLATRVRILMRMTNSMKEMGLTQRKIYDLNENLIYVKY